MRRIQTDGWSKTDSVALSVFASNLVLKYFNRRFRKDKNPKQAVKAAREWLRDPSSNSFHALCMAADSAYASARICAGSAHWAARCAAIAARCAAASSDQAAGILAKAAVESAEKAAHWKGGPKIGRIISSKIERHIQKRTMPAFALGLFWLIY